MTAPADPGHREAEALVVAVDRLIGQVQHWTPPRWRAASGVSGSGTGFEAGAGPEVGAARVSRGEVFHALVQRIADLAAAAEGQPRRPVPRLENDLALPDQLAVVTRDLLCAAPAPAVLAAARDAVTETRSSEILNG